MEMVYIVLRARHVTIINPPVIFSCIDQWCPSNTRLILCPETMMIILVSMSAPNRHPPVPNSLPVNHDHCPLSQYWLDTKGNKLVLCIVFRARRSIPSGIHLAPIYLHRPESPVTIDNRWPRQPLWPPAMRPISLFVRQKQAPSPKTHHASTSAGPRSAVHLISIGLFRDTMDDSYAVVHHLHWLRFLEIDIGTRFSGPDTHSGYTRKDQWTRIKSLHKCKFILFDNYQMLKINKMERIATQRTVHTTNETPSLYAHRHCPADSWFLMNGSHRHTIDRLIVSLRCTHVLLITTWLTWHRSRNI